VILQPLLDAVLVDVGGTLVHEAGPATPVADLEAKLRPGVLEDLAAVAAQVPVGAVTNTATMTAPQVRALLEPSGVSDWLEVVVTSVDVGQRKPDPLPLLVAMERLGLSDPRRVLFVGDQPSDAEAAQAAGMAYADVAGATVGEAIETWTEQMAGGRFESARAAIRPVDGEAMAEATAHQDRLTKPPGALGRLEAASIKLAGIAGTSPPPVPEPAVVAVFAGDHGVLAAGVSAWPQEVTAQMVANFEAGGAAINVLARQVGADVVVVDVGVATPFDLPSATDDGQPGVRRRKVARGTADLSQGPAMTRTEALLALDVGVETAQQAVADGARCLITGDMGIGNTTASAALIAAFTGRPGAEVTGRGAGADDEVLARKVEVVESAVERLPATAGPLARLAEVGGLEIAALAGFLIGGAAAGVPVIVDGVIATAAAVVAVALSPDTRCRLVAGHRSVEPGASVALEHLELEPLLDLDLRLGEGTGAVLALPLLQASAHLLAEMATFDSAGVSDKDHA
jgi:nicotinate-nucleotide--dimethylbenzimidazole phosphoribosyltransferase